MPPTGLEINQIDSIQKELNQLCRKITPNYFPIVEPIDFQDRKVLVLWCPGGSIRPYKCPDSLGKHPNYLYYLRKFSSTVKPNIDEEHELVSLSNKVPFDDRVNHFHKVSDFDLGAIKTFLNKVGSELEKDIPKLSIVEIARRMNIAEGSDEYLLPKNIGLLFFAKEPQKVFPSAKIEIVNFRDEAGTDYTEKIFTGNLMQQLTAALDYLKNQIVIEKVVKVAERAEADRFYNYPYIALEEALCNAVYHRGYDNDSPIEVRIYPTRIDMISFPGPLPPLNKQNLENNRFDIRKYRNRRVGGFLKELHLTEGRATGIPTIMRELEKNGSPGAVFETDEERYYFKTAFKIHKKFIPDTKSEQVTMQVKTHIDSDLDVLWEQASPQVPRKYPASTPQVPRKYLESSPQAVRVLQFCAEYQLRNEIQEHIGLFDREHFRKTLLKPLIENLLLKMSQADKPNSPKQKYMITEKGKLMLKVFGKNNK